MEYWNDGSMKVGLIFLLLITNVVSAVEKETLNQDPSIIKAAAAGNSSEVRNLLNRGIKVDSRHSLTGWTALIAASYYGHIETTRVLIEAGADVNAKDKKGGTPLLKAVTLDSSENSGELLANKALVVRELLKSGADPQIRDSIGTTAWEVAMVNGHVELILVFEEEKVKGIKETRMINAAASGDGWLVKQMLEEGADVNYKDADGWSALSEASLGAHLEILKILVASGADVNLKHQKGWTSLMVAAQKNHEGVVRFLLKSGADPQLRSDDGATAAMIATKQGNLAIAELLK